MSDFMLLGILRMPIEADDGIVAFTQFRSAARSAADLIEQLTAERDRLREALEAGRRLWAIAQDDRVRLLIQLEQCEKRHD